MSTFVQIRADGGTPISIAQQTSTDVANTPELLTTAGAGNWTKPAGVTKVLVECWGGGGAGGGASATDSGGPGGAGGSYARSTITYSTTEQSVSYVVGAGGSGGTGNGGAGGNSTWNTNVVVAQGGHGGLGSQLVDASKTTGSISISVGQVLYKGGDSDFGGQLFNYISGLPDGGTGGGGGGGAGSTGDGDSAVLFNTFGEPGLSTFEFGGAGGSGSGDIFSGGVNGLTPNELYGGGGGGAAKVSGPNRTGGSGAQGLIRITTYSTTTTTPPGVPAGGNK